MCVGVLANIINADKTMDLLSCQTAVNDDLEKHRKNGLAELAQTKNRLRKMVNGLGGGKDWTENVKRYGDYKRVFQHFAERNKEGEIKKFKPTPRNVIFRELLLDFGQRTPGFVRGSARSQRKTSKWWHGAKVLGGSDINVRIANKLNKLVETCPEVFAVKRDTSSDTRSGRGFGSR
jgi:hypothetical protein